VLEGLGGHGASGAGGGTIIVPGWVGAEVALPRPHLVKATCVELGEAHERMGLERGAVGISRWVWRGPFPLLHKEFPAEEFKLRVRAARGRSGVCLAYQVLGGDREGGVAVRAKEKKHRVGEGVQGEVGCSSRGVSVGAKVAVGGCPHFCGRGPYGRGSGGLAKVSGGRPEVWPTPGLSLAGNTSP